MANGRKASGDASTGGHGAPVVVVMDTATATTRRRSRAGSYGVVFGELPERRPVAVGGNDKTSSRRSLAPRAVAADSHRAHGTYAKYVVERCGCEPCRGANRAYVRRRQRSMARPDELWLPYVPAGPARRHLAALARQGIGLKTVAKLTGLAHGALSRIVYGDPARGSAPSKRVRPETLSAILGVEAQQASGGQKVPAGPTWALLDQLLTAGYTRTFLAAALGSRGKHPSLQIRRDRVRGSTARAVEALHRRLIDQQPPPRRTRWST